MTRDASVPLDSGAPSLAFGPFELKPAERLLLRDGEPVELRAKAFDLLTVLAQRAGRLVTKSDLLDLVWAGLVVEESNVATQVAALRKVVGGDLVVTVPGRGYRFVAEVRRSDADASTAGVSAAASAPVVSLDLPAQKLFGREDDLRRLHAALDLGGVVTLVGAGGVGKTVLARVALAQRPAQRSAFVDLAALDGPSQVLAAVCRALGIATPAAPSEREDAVVASLGEGSWLLVLDNAEHLVDEIARLCAALLAAMPGLAVLVTSQLPLRIAGESVQALEPLALPDEGGPGEATLASAPVQLLIERIRAADGRSPIGPEALPLLRSLCAHLDGLPLAIEMAASLVPLLGLAGVLAALDQRFEALRRGRREAPARHKTLRAALEWSVDLLSPSRQRGFRRLGVFASSFGLDLAVAVMADAGEDRWDVVDTFSELVDRSLVASLHTDPPRYRLLESMRSFALEALDGAPDADGEGTRVRAVAALTVRMRQYDPGDPQGVAADLPSVPEALRWARLHGASAALELTLAASNAATWTPWLAEALRWVEACEPLLGAGLTVSQQALWWREFARLQTFVRGSRAVEAARKAAALERSLGNPEGVFWCLIPLLRSSALEPAEFAACREEAQTLLDQHPQWPGRARATFSGSLAREYRRRGDFETALVHQRAEAEQARGAGLPEQARNAESNMAATLIGLRRYEDALAILDRQRATAGGEEDAVGAHDWLQRISALIRLGRLAEVEALAPEALRSCRRFRVLDITEVFALFHALRGQMDTAALLLGHHRESLRRLGADRMADPDSPWREAERLAGDALGSEALAGVTDRGARLSADEADALILARRAPAAAPLP